MKDVLDYSKELGICLQKDQLQMFVDYETILLEYNKVMNLTRIIKPEEIALKHFADSLSVIPFISEYFPKKEELLSEYSLIDVGTGAGFPGIPLKIALPWLNVTLLDSLKKRLKFLETVIENLSLKGINTVHHRAEDAGRSESMRDFFDIAIARAVAPLPSLAEYCLPLVRPGGVFVSMKSDCESEIADSKHAISLLGGRIEDVHEYTLNDGELSRTLVIIRKLKKRLMHILVKQERSPLILLLRG